LDVDFFALLADRAAAAGGVFPRFGLLCKTVVEFAVKEI
jgi:hypothetical protein